MVALIHSENNTANRGKTAGRYQFNTHLSRVNLVDEYNAIRDHLIKHFIKQRLSTFLINCQKFTIAYLDVM